MGAFACCLQQVDESAQRIEVTLPKALPFAQQPLVVAAWNQFAAVQRNGVPQRLDTVARRAGAFARGDKLGTG